MDDFIEIRIGSSFLINAGITGFIRFLKANQEESNFKIEGQSLKISKDWLINNDIPQMYVDTMGKLFEPLSLFAQEVKKADYYINQLGEEQLDEAQTKQITKYFAEFAKMLEKASFKSAYEIAANYYSDDVIPLDLQLIDSFKKEKDLINKKEHFSKIISILNQPKLYRTILFKELMYSKIKLFFEGISFYLPANLKMPIEDCYKKDFYQPLVDELITEKKKNKICIECGGQTMNARSISFMIDTTDDMARKKSYYWNCKPDAFVCPICAFLYTFVPLGFAFLGGDAVFVNNNCDIDTMIGLMSSYDSASDAKDDTDKKSSFKSKFYRGFTKTKSEMLMKKVGNIQVITKSRNASHYQLNVIGKDVIKKIDQCKDELSKLEKIYVKIDSEFISVYDEVFDNILYARNQYQLMNRLLKNELKEKRNINYIKNILDIQVNFKGGEQMEAMKKNVDIAFACGIEMRNSFGQNISDVDNSLRGVVYRLSNSLSTGNLQQYLDSIIRVYSGMGLPIPYIFKECYVSEEMFKAIGQGFVLGLKYVKYVGKETENNV